MNKEALETIVKEFDDRGLKEACHCKKCCESIKYFLSSSLQKAYKLGAEAMKEAMTVERSKHEDIIQLTVNDQGTTAGKLHYAREYGKQDGWDKARKQSLYQGQKLLDELK